MAKRTQLYRVAAATMASLIGRAGEVIVNTTRNSLHVHDGLTPNGTEVARADLTNVAGATASAAGKMTAAQAASLASISSLAIGAVPGGRLSAHATDPMAEASGSTLYYLPFISNKIALYNVGTLMWELLTFSATSISGVVSANKGIDVFGYNNASALGLELVAWSSSNARATALATQDGVYVKTGDASRRYLGSYYQDTLVAVADLLLARNVWNMYNRVDKPVFDQTSGNWTYSAAPFVTMLSFGVGGPAPNISVMCGIVGQCAINLTMAIHAQNSTATERNYMADIYLNGSVASQLDGRGYATNARSLPSLAQFAGVGVLGVNVFNVKHNGAGVDTQTWGSSGGTWTDGLQGRVIV